MCEIRENAMQKKQFQQNMKDKVRVFEDGGIRLLKRGQKGVVHAIFSADAGAGRAAVLVHQK